jgi:hypothetical protein
MALPQKGIHEHKYLPFDKFQGCLGIFRVPLKFLQGENRVRRDTNHSAFSEKYGRPAGVFRHDLIANIEVCANLGRLPGVTLNNTPAHLAF